MKLTLVLLMLYVTVGVLLTYLGPLATRLAAERITAALQVSGPRALAYLTTLRLGVVLL